MSTDYYIHVGPYIKVYNPKRNSSKTVNTCVNTTCKKHKQNIYGNDKFCSECGNQIKMSEFSCMAALQFDIYEEFKDTLAKVIREYKPIELMDYQFFVGNTKGTPSKRICVSESEGESQIMFDKITDDCLTFCDMYRKEINRLYEVFGKDNVSVKFGVLHSISA